MGNYRICDFCGNLYERSESRMCQSCETTYKKIRSIVEARPDTIVLDISNQTGISVSRILSFVKNGYFSMREGTIEVK
ncbi:MULTISPECIES: hypothetical protein [Paenibacillus]|uniref:Flagellar protein n=1 Tax=Paenibacillus vini TaxID=1476024 RepID=A0ABQ4MHD9_9BACL|nr:MULTISPECIES: hypothetical protein [Paenibacillus]MBQ4897613.1 hypothetical protein [Paenibacillus sp. Marseille-P2973]MDN4070154.1 hypothetical protein [Paenibacillus vini]GIP55372.1 hypothetical protein J42TS3_44070 [Paenibacillus vini]